MFTLCYKIPNRLGDDGYEIKIFDSYVLPFLNYEVVIDEIGYIIERVEVRSIANHPVYFALLAVRSDDSYVDDLMLRKIAEHLLGQQPEKR